MSSSAGMKLIVDLYDANSKDLPLFKIIINGKSWNYRIPAFNSNKDIEKEITKMSEYKIEIPIPENLIRIGGNEISITVIDGSWIKFDQIKLESTQSVRLAENKQVFVRSAKPANYEIKTEKLTSQPLLVDLEYLSGQPKLKVVVDGAALFSETLESGRYTFEVPMPSVDVEQKSTYTIFADDRKIQSGTVLRSPQKITTPAGYVDTKMVTAHSCWMIAPGPWMPFSMVKLSPDNQPYGWQSGYDPTFEFVGTFSHIHEWTMVGQWESNSTHLHGTKKLMFRISKSISNLKEKKEVDIDFKLLTSYQS